MYVTEINKDINIYISRMADEWLTGGNGGLPSCSFPNSAF